VGARSSAQEHAVKVLVHAVDPQALQAWRQLVRSSALATGKREKNVDAVYTTPSSLRRQVTALGGTIDEVLRLAQPRITLADKGRVTDLLQAAVNELNGTDKGAMAAFSSIQAVHGAQQKLKRPKCIKAAAPKAKVVQPVKSSYRTQVNAMPTIRTARQVPRQKEETKDVNRSYESGEEEGGHEPLAIVGQLRVGGRVEYQVASGLAISRCFGASR
jgi:hypothetical protein